MATKDNKLNKGELIYLYLIEGLSCRKIGEKFNTDQWSIWRLLKQNAILTRKSGGMPGKESPHWKGGKIKAPCQGCGKVKMVYPSHANSYKYCPSCKESSLDLSGQRFGRLIVIRRDENSKNHKTKWLCKCDCGNEKITLGATLKNGMINSCGCGRKGEFNPRYNRIKIECSICGKERIVSKAHTLAVKEITCGSKECRSKLQSLYSGSKNGRWLNGGVGYEVCAIALAGIEEIRRNPEDKRILQTRCAYCNRWFNPNQKQIAARKRVILGQKGGTGEARLYCSDGCKSACPTYRKKYYPAGFKKGSSREVSADLRKMVLERDNWQCQICDSKENLHCHHIESYNLNKIMAEDMDNCITLCKTHHRWVHSKEGCKYYELKCNEKIA